jgi:hypothetical protein
MTIRLETECVTAMVIPAGGIVWRPRFKLPQAGWVEPFAVAPWAASGADDPDVPAYLRMLGGAFLAAPFGGRAVPAAQATGPRRRATTSSTAPPGGAHGGSSTGPPERCFYAWISLRRTR